MGLRIKNKMRTVLMPLAILLLSVLSTKTAEACHFAAADIYVTYAGKGADGCSSPEYKYDISLTIYLGCQNCYLDAGTTQTVRYESLNGATGVNNITVTDPNARPDTTHSLCPAFAPLNSCRILANKDQYPAFRVRRYTGTVTLPSPQTDWRFWWSNGGRNTSNLTGCGSLYLEAGLNNLTKYNNSTPRFLSNPLPYICINQPTTYLNEPYDINGDSLEILQQTPFTPAGNVGNPCGYAAGYSVADPIASAASNPYKLNSITGTATFTPTAQGFFVFAFRANDYERGTGIPLSYVYRDVQVSVLPCTAPPPDIDDLQKLSVKIKEGTIINTKDGDVVFACPGSNLEFEVNSQTDSTTHNLYMTANNNIIAGSAFSAVGQGTNNVTGTFTWTPTTADIGEHSLVVTSKDSTCAIWQPIVLKNARTILIKVVAGLDAGPDLPICQLNPTPRQLFVKGADDLKVSWEDQNGGPAIGLSNSNIHNPVATTTITRSYVVKTPDLIGNCKNRDTVAVFIDTSNKITTLPRSPIIQCRPDYIQLEALITGKPPQSNVKCGVSNPTSCTTPEEATVFGSPVYGTVPYDTFGATTPTLQNNVYTMKHQYLIRKADLWESGLRSATINSLSMELDKSTLATHRYNNFTIKIKCTNKDELTTNGGFENGLVQVYSSANEFMPNGWKEFVFTTPYNWDTTRNLIVEFCYSNNDSVVVSCNNTAGQPPLIKYSPTTYVSGLTLLPADTFAKDVCAVNNSTSIEAVQARPIFRFKYCEADPQPFVVNWSPGEFLSDSTIRQPLAYAPATTDYVVETFGRSGCIVRDTVGIYVPKHDFKVFPEDTAVCYNDGVPFKAYNGFTYNWYEYKDGKYLNAEKSLSCVDCPDPIATPKKSTVYRVAISDSVWCYDTVEARVTIMPLPDVRILNKDDSTIKYGQSFKLLATGARMYNWSPVSSLTNPNISYPIATPKEATRYIVGGIGLNGCRAFDTLHVSVDYRDNLFVPTAFSPNGDGKNDLFKVSNLSFQRVMEFRVFNRWGQEIFSGAGPNVAWNGTWKGEPQDMGNYSYIIRVGFPDGYVETYKGEVTLIR
ncbi:MAG: gliding motility-associated C-terminal domain-containing protein [Flavipsychrobacter sp.]